MRPHYLILLSLLVFASVSALATARLGGIPGGWTPIKDIKNDPHVAEIAEYAVTEYDKRAGANLKLVKVVKGETQVVAGINYRLVLKTKDGSKTRDYEAVVWEKAWQHFRNLTSFTPLQ